MCGLHLAVDEAEAPVLQVADQGGEAGLGGVAHAAEHGFAEEGTADGHAVETADQPVGVVVHLDTVGVAGHVQPVVGVLHVFRDPGAVLARAGLGTGLDDGLEVGVETDVEAPVAQHLAQAAVHAELVREQHHARVRAPPQDGLALLVPGEDAAAVGGQQARLRQIAAHGQQAIGFVQGLIHRGKGLRTAGRQPGDLDHGVRLSVSGRWVAGRASLRNGLRSYRARHSSVIICRS